MWKPNMPHKEMEANAETAKWKTFGIVKGSDMETGIGIGIGIDICTGTSFKDQTCANAAL